LRELSKLGLPFLLGGTYALSVYTGITRATKDLDIVCKPSDCTSILQHFKRLGYAVEIEDERWIAKVFRGEHFFDLIFASWHGAMPVSDRWFDHAPRVEIFGMPVRVIAPTELIWSKARSTAASLRRRGHRASDTQAARADRLAASPRLHGPALGSVAGPPSQFPLGLPERTRPRAALAHGRAARPARAAARPAAPAREDMPRSNVLADRLRAGG